MNGPRRTACFAKEMHSYTLFTLKLYPEVIPKVIPEVQPEITDELTDERTDNVQIFISLQLLTSLCETIRNDK